MLPSCNEYLKILTSKSRTSAAIYPKTVTKWTWTSGYIRTSEFQILANFLTLEGQKFLKTSDSISSCT